MVKPSEFRLAMAESTSLIRLRKRSCSEDYSGNPYLTKFAPEDKGLWVYLA